MEMVLPEVRDTEGLEKIYRQLASIADIILDGYVGQLESLKVKANRQQHYNELQRRYEQDRQQLIMPLSEFQNLQGRHHHADILFFLECHY